MYQDIRSFFKVTPSNNDTTNLLESINTIKDINTIKTIKKISVFTDGSSFNNGSKTKKHSGGLGIFFGDDDLINQSIKLIESEKQPITNNIAELKACIKAIEVILDSERNDNEIITIIIYTDSEYVINSITKWAKLWKFNGWKRKEGTKFKDIKNKELIEILFNLYNTHKIRFKHVKAHKRKPNKPNTSQEYIEWYGNYMADKLATDASKL